MARNNNVQVVYSPGLFGGHSPLGLNPAGGNASAALSNSTERDRIRRGLTPRQYHQQIELKDPNTIRRNLFVERAQLDKTVKANQKQLANYEGKFTNLSRERVLTQPRKNTPAISPAAAGAGLGLAGLLALLLL